MDIQELKRTTLTRCAPYNAFHVCRGDVIDSIYDLANCIASLSAEQFKFHVNAETKTNHFGQWIKDVLKNPALAHDLNFDSNLRDQKMFVKTIRDHVAWLEHC